MEQLEKIDFMTFVRLLSGAYWRTVRRNYMEEFRGAFNHEGGVLASYSKDACICVDSWLRRIFGRNPSMQGRQAEDRI